MAQKLPLLLIIWISFFSLTGNAQKTGDAYPDPRESVNEGIALHDEKKYKEAIEKYKLVHESDSFYDNALYEMSVSYYADKQYEQSAQCALKGLQMKSHLEREFIISYANALDHLEKTDSALHMYDMGLAKYPYYYRYEYEKGVLYARKKDWKNALKHYTAALEINPYYPVAHLRIGILAADAGKPAFALMALNTFCWVSSNADQIFSCIKIMENIANNAYTTEQSVDASIFAAASELEETDLIIHSKAALSPKYKCLLKSDFHIVKQMQVLCEKMPASLEKGDWISNFYLNMYKGVWDKKVFQGSMLHTIRTIDNKKVKSELKSKERNVNEFLAYTNEYLSGIRDYKTVNQNGAKVKIRLWFQDGDLRAIGNRSSSDLNEGRWVFYGDYGHIKAEGEYVNGLKQGLWKYYYDSGELKSEEQMKDGKNHGRYKKYHTNGALLDVSEYNQGELVGEIKLYNSNNTLSAHITITDAKKGIITRENYNEFGVLRNAGQLINGDYEGWYKSYNSDGILELEATTLKGNLTGVVEYKYPDGKTRTKGTYTSSGNRTGEWIWYYPNGNIETTGQYTGSGKEAGTWKFYYDNGNLSKEEIYENNSKGAYKLYDYDGKLYAEMTLKNGRIDTYTYYDRDGKPLAEGKTKSGKLNLVTYSEFRNKIVEGQLINGQEEGTWKYYYENGALEYELPYVKGKREGIMTYYSRNGKPEYEILYRNNEREGFYRSYFLNGSISCEGYYKEGKRNGTWTYYFANGKINTREFYLNDKITGKDYEHFPDGTLEGFGTYELGFFNNFTQTDSLGNPKYITGLQFGTGKYILYTRNEIPIIEAYYKGGVKDSTFKSFYGINKQMTEESYSFGKRNGTFKRFHENGKLNSTGIYRNGEMDSVWNFYGEDGKITRTSMYKEGELHGPYKTFYNTGKTDVECTYYKGLLHGTYREFAPDGLLTIEATYNGGVLTSYTYTGKDGKPMPSIAVNNETADIKTYYVNGNVALSYKLVNGLIQGEYQLNYSDGKPFVRSTYVNGLNEGKYTVYYPNGNLKRVENYFYDEKDGLCVYYHENGKVAKELNYIFDYKHGESRVFDANGQLTRKITYFFNRIIN